LEVLLAVLAEQKFLIWLLLAVAVAADISFWLVTVLVLAVAVLVDTEIHSLVK
jgi:hypothetical protein